MMYDKMLGVIASASLALALPQYAEIRDEPYSPASLKMSCSRLVLDRIDPLNDPGVFGTSHLHTIVGGNSFNATMDPAGDPAERSSCTTCTFTDDFSNYWTPAMYFRARNGSYKRVEQLGALFHEEARGGGMTIYYFPRFMEPEKIKIRAFAPGFRMRLGWPDRDSPMRAPWAMGREGDDISPFDGVTYTCLYTESTRYSNLSWGFPDLPCREGILTTVAFPTCWDGKNLDSPDHMSHVAFALADDLYGPPGAHPGILIETRWDKRPFNDPELWPENEGEQPFVWSYGDGVGYGFHADYVFGWRGNALQEAFERHNCGNQICGLPIQTIPEANECMIEPSVPEEVDGWMDTLPGGVVVVPD
ncbi:hypothetical protein C7999DRAFT_30252 [Corynascus novoguineensis]|uniref:DUF1996 domain-containing protein n=1 Tax=Corynascus novoguineensis TaxID=1126955 RepID=A0AAN7HR73_9PEZI|nr:hypothetical protein C7999DRAFT_30252 [Corynascus novoguineensis]